MNATATVETLTAEVRALMVGNRQVTLSVFNQLDDVEPDEIEPFGRVSPREPGAWLVGRDSDGTLVRCDYSDLGYNRYPFATTATRWATLGAAFTNDARKGYALHHHANQSCAHVTTDVRLVLSIADGRDRELSAATWRFTSDAAEAAVMQEAQDLQLLIDKRRQQRRSFDALPLIVLAGLR